MSVQMTHEELLSKAQPEIKAKIEALKKENSQLKLVYPIVVFGEEYDDKEIYIAYFRQPSFTAFSKYLSASESNQAVAMRTLANDCFLAGDKDVIENDSLFLFGLMGQLSKIIKMRNGQLVNL